MGGINSYITSGNSILIKPANVNEIVNAVNTFINLNNIQKEKMSFESKKLFDTLFDWEDIADLFYNTFLKLGLKKYV